MFEMKKESEYAHVLRGIADGEQIQSCLNVEGDWVNRSHLSILREIANGVETPSRYRIKPRTSNINGYEVPEPLRVAPKKGTTYYSPHVLAEDLHVAWLWHGNQTDNRLLLLGMVHKTQEAAIDHAKALLSFTEVEE